MKCLPLALAGLMIASLAPAARSAGPYPYDGGPNYNVGYAGYSDYGYGGYGYSPYQGCGQGCGWLQPGCCERGWSPYDNVWDGYCNERLHGWGSHAARGYGRGSFGVGSYGPSSGCTNCNQGNDWNAPSSIISPSPVMAPSEPLEAPVPPSEPSARRKQPSRSTLRVVPQTSR